MDHILHRLDDLTDVICVILSKKNILHRLFLRTDVIYSFLPYFEARVAHSRAISLCHVIATSATSSVCYCQRVSIYQDSKQNAMLTKELAKFGRQSFFLNIYYKRKT